MNPGALSIVLKLLEEEHDAISHYARFVFVGIASHYHPRILYASVNALTIQFTQNNKHSSNSLQIRSSVFSRTYCSVRYISLKHHSRIKLH